MSRLEQAIAQLYFAFADVPKPERIDACSHCIDDREIRTLLDTPLRELTPDDLSSYGTSVFLTAGSEADFLYFLPRVLEISATDDSWWPSPEVVGRAVRTSRPEAWPAVRQSALASFLSVLIESIVEAGQYWRIDDWMCAIAKIGLDVRPYLGRIAESKEAILAYFEDNAKCLQHRRLCNSFWELPCPAHDVIVEWFFSEEIRMIPFEAYGCAQLLSPGYEAPAS